MKSQSRMNTIENDSKSPTGAQDRQDGEDTEDDDDEDRSEQATVTVADVCSASHEFEWLSPNSQGPIYSHNEKQVEKDVYSHPPQGLDDQGLSSCQVSPARSFHNRYNKPPLPVCSRHGIMDHVRMSPNPYNEFHGCRRHLSPMRSSWCCPSPPPVCMRHGGSVLSGMEIVPYNYDYYGNEMPFLSYHNCSCLSHHESQSWCRNTSSYPENIQRESSSPCAVHRSCQGLGRRSRSSISRKRDYSPSAASPRCSPVQQDSGSNQRQQWQIPVSVGDANSLQKLHNLESDKKNLILHASVLADQVEAQSEKINELERLLDEKKEELLRLEQSLHQEVLARSSAENSKLELMTELSNLRLRLIAVERDRKESDEKGKKLQSELLFLQDHLIDHESEVKGKSSHDASYILNINEVTDITSQKSTVLNTDSAFSSINSNLIKPSLVNTIKKSQELSPAENISLTSPHCNKSLHLHSSTIGSLNSTATVSSFQKSNSVENLSQPAVVHTLVPNSQYGTMPRQTSSKVLQQLQGQFREHVIDPNNKTPSLEKTIVQRNNSSKEYSKVNRSAIRSGGKSSGVSFGKGFFKLRSGKRSSSEPYLAAEECVTITSTEKENNDLVPSLTPQPYLIKAEKDRKGFLKFFSKFKKSGSQNIDRIDGDFKRGGMRATAGPRLGWSRDVSQDLNIPFSQWNTDAIMEWLQRLGLSMYTSECKRWMCNGEILAKATANDLEKELGIKNPLHRKKLILAIKSLNSGLTNLPASIHTLDYNWVVRWLDDVGLPQYKDSFADARVDGRVLHCITVDDLLFLKVTSQLHHVSIRRGIQLLREKAFDPHCLIRRSFPDESKSYTPELVALWSNHRVMEWLRTVDLSEYAPNLRGSGVHGALIVYEPRFNTSLFATLLNIPPTKTLLRRHLATHFKHIVREELSQIKREKETDTPLSPSVKIKVIRKTQFALKKKRNKNEIENEDFVCPMDIPVTLTTTDAPKLSEVEKLVVRRNSDPSPHEQRHIDLKIILQDENLNGAPTTVV